MAKASAVESRNGLQQYAELTESKSKVTKQTMDPSVAREAGVLCISLFFPPVKVPNKHVFRHGAVKDNM